MKTLPSLPVKILLVSVMFLLGMFVAQGQDGFPDPILLLRGVEAARLQIPPSSLEVREVFSRVGETNTIDMTIEFDGLLRSFAPISGKDTNPLWSTLFNGERGLVYQKQNSSVRYNNINSLNNQLPLYDPRLLGLGDTFLWQHDFDDVLLYGLKGAKYEVVGRDTFGEQTAWHVRISKDQRPVADIWIDDANDFRVYQYNFNREFTKSYYSPIAFPWLPDRIVTEEYSRLVPAEGEIPLYTRETTIRSATANVKFPKNRWSLEGMRLPVGTYVDDYELGVGLGIWDGKKVVVESPTVATTSTGRYFAMGLVLLAVCFPMVVWALYKKRRSS